MPGFETIGALLLDIYRSARERSETKFQDHALRLLDPLLHFESAIWGTGVMNDEAAIAPSSAHLHEVDPAAFAEWRQINRRDKVIAIAARQYGRTIQFHAPTLFRAPEDAVMRDYALRFGRQSYLITGLAEGAPGSGNPTQAARVRADAELEPAVSPPARDAPGSDAATRCIISRASASACSDEARAWAHS